MNLEERLRWYEELSDEDIDNMSDEDLEQMEKDLGSTQDDSDESQEDDELVNSDNENIEKPESSTKSVPINNSNNLVDDSGKLKTKDTTVKLDKNSVSVNTDTPSTSKDNAFILRSINVPLISYTNITQNRTLYTAEAMESGLNHPITRDAIKGKKFYSELDHPNVDIENRIKTRLNSPIVGNITKVWRNEEDQHYWGTLDVFNNDSGNLAINLLDYGSELGISIRAEGNSVDKVDANGIPYSEIIADGDFVIWGFDVVIFPSSKEAVIPNSKTELLESVLDSRGVSFLNTTQSGLKFKRSLFEGYKSSRFNQSNNILLEEGTDTSTSNTPTILDINKGSNESLKPRGSHYIEDKDYENLMRESLELYKGFGEEDSAQPVSTIKNNGIEMGSNKDNISLKVSKDTSIINDVDLLKDYTSMNIDNPIDDSAEQQHHNVVMEESSNNESSINSNLVNDLTYTLGKLLDFIGISEDDYDNLSDLNDLIDDMYLEDDQDTEDYEDYALDDDEFIEDEFDTYEPVPSISTSSRIGNRSRYVKSRPMTSHKEKLLESIHYKKPSKSNVVRQYKVVSDNPFIRNNENVSENIFTQMGFKFNE